MNDCESYEALSSALVDDQLEHDEILEIVDHLVRCPRCRRFYAGARSLDGLLEVTGLGESTAKAPERVWERLSGRPASDPPRPRSSSLSGWLLPLAATVALLIGVGFTLPEPVAVETNQVPTALPAKAMDEERFVALTTELLQADRRYHHAMLEIMEEVDEVGAGREASGEGAAVRSEDDESRSRV